MSASERLRKLPLAGTPWTPAEILHLAQAAQIDSIVLVLNALPEIVAVVEAAEWALDPITGSLPIDEEEALEMAQDRLRPALAALEEKLRP